MPVNVRLTCLNKSPTQAYVVRHRRLRVRLLRGLRTVRAHYLSVLSAVVVAGLLGLALTSASFELDDGGKPRPPSPASSGVAAAPAPMPPASEPHAAQPSQTVVYYIVSSPEQAVALYGARRADAQYFADQGLPPFPPVSAYYVMYRSSEEEREGERLLHDLANLAPDFGIEFYIVDLRK